MLPSGVIKFCSVNHPFPYVVGDPILDRGSEPTFLRPKGKKLMCKSSRRTLLALFLTLFVFAALATVTSADHSWGGYHFARTSNPFTIKTGDNVSAAWDPYLDEAISDWNQSSVLDLLEV